MATPAEDPRPDLVEHEQYLRRLARCLVLGDPAFESTAPEASAKPAKQPPRAPEDLRVLFAKVTRNGGARRARRWGQAGGPAARPVAPATAAAIAQAETLGRIASAADAVSEPYRTVVLLRYYADFSDDEIATTLGGTPDTAKVQLTQALNLLRASMDDYDRAKASADIVPWRDSVMGLLGLG